MQTDFFEILAECSIALAGFGAIHAALQGIGGPRGTLRAWFVVCQGAMAFSLCLLVLLLDLSSLSGTVLWRVAGVIGVLPLGGLVYAFLRVDARMTSLGYPPQALLNLRTAQTMCVVSTLLLLSNATGVPWAAGPLFFGIAVTFILISGLLALIHSFFVPLQASLSGEHNEPEIERPVA